MLAVFAVISPFFWFQQRRYAVFMADFNSAARLFGTVVLARKNLDEEKVNFGPMPGTNDRADG